MTPRLHRVGVHNDHSGMPDHYVYQCRVCERLYTHHALLDDHTCASDAQPATFEAELAAAREQMRGVLDLLDRVAFAPNYAMTPADLAAVRRACEVCGMTVMEWAKP